MIVIVLFVGLLVGMVLVIVSVLVCFVCFGFIFTVFLQSLPLRCCFHPCSSESLYTMYAPEVPFSNGLAQPLYFCVL